MPVHSQKIQASKFEYTPSNSAVETNVVVTFRVNTGGIFDRAEAEDLARFQSQTPHSICK